MNANQTVSAAFDLVDRNLTVHAARMNGDSAADGSVTSDVGGIDCAVPNDCSQDYTHGTTVVLTASPAANNVFSSWTGCDNPNGVTCTMTMNGAKVVTAEFHNSTIPSSSITSVPGSTNDASPDFAYTADAGSGLSLTVVELWVNGPGAGPFVKVAEKTDGATTGTFAGVALGEGDGDYQVKTRAANNAGNAEEGAVRSFVLDTQAPSSSVTSDATQNVNTFDLAWTSNHGADATGVSTVELWVDGPGAGGSEMVDTDPARLRAPSPSRWMKRAATRSTPWPSTAWATAKRPVLPTPSLTSFSVWATRPTHASTSLGPWAKTSSRARRQTK